MNTPTFPRREPTGDLGTEDNPVRCDSPNGEAAYIRRLRDPDGHPPTFMRMGSFGPGPYGNLLDGYELHSVKTPGVIHVDVIYMDMYHPGFVETRPVPGYSFVWARVPQQLVVFFDRDLEPVKLPYLGVVPTSILMRFESAPSPDKFMPEENAVNDARWFDPSDGLKMALAITEALDNTWVDTIGLQDLAAQLAKDIAMLAYVLDNAIQRRARFHLQYESCAGLPPELAAWHEKHAEEVQYINDFHCDEDLLDGI